MSWEQIGLNIGGQVYRTTRSTLSRSDQGSLLHQLVQPREGYDADKDEQGNYFFDRDGILFRYILNYLRSGGRCPFPKNSEDLNSLKEEAIFYGLKNLQTAIQERENLAGQQPATAEYLKLVVYANFATSDHRLHGPYQVLSSFTELRNPQVGISGDCMEIGSSFSWSHIVEILTKYGFMCKSVAYAANESYGQSEIWLFEKDLTRSVN